MMKRSIVDNGPRLFRTCLRSPGANETKCTRPMACGIRERRHFHGSRALREVRPYLLADIGEGITECQVIQWFVQPGARVEQFDKICEVQSDKAAVEITSRFDGVIKKLHYEADDMAKVGRPLVDIDIQGEISPEAEALTEVPEEQAGRKPVESKDIVQDKEQPVSRSQKSSEPQQERPVRSKPSSNTHAALATPAVRHLIKEFDLNIKDIAGSGRDGRVLKEDVQKHAASISSDSASSDTQAESPASITVLEPQGEDRTVPLTPIQNQMFKSMTRSLSIPHFLYTDTVDFTALTSLRQRHNARAATDPNFQKISPLAFIIKAVSLALRQYPLLNAHLDTTAGAKPVLTHKAHHNIGVAVASPAGLIVPVIRAVEYRSVASIAAEIARLSALAHAGRLSASDLSGATFTVSNIGNIGGLAVAPVIMSPQVGILGVGRARVVPAFGPGGDLVRREECVFSWSADHRVVDGATAARCAEAVRGYLEDTGTMLVELR